MGGWNAIYNQTRLALRRHGEALAMLQETVATGSRLRRASDAPAEAFRLMGLRGQDARLTTYRDNLGRISDTLRTASDVVAEMAGLVARARELVAQGASGTYSAANRSPIALELDSLLGQMVLLANTRHGGTYLFSGAAAEVPPFEAVEQDGRITAVRYVGSPEAIEAPVAPAMTQPTALVGDDLFRGRRREAPEFLGETGAAAGAGTSTVCTVAWLTVSHTSTTYLGASGIAPGTSSAAGDTVLGNGHTLTVDEPARTLRLDDGPPVTFTPGATDVCVTNAAGDRVYVDTSGLVAGFQGTVGIQAAGTLSIDDGLSSTAIDFAEASLAVAHAETGRVLYVDCTGIARTGVELVRLPGTVDVFSALIAVRDLMANTRNLPEPKQVEWLTQMNAVLSEAADRLTMSETALGSTLGTLEDLDASLESRQARAQDEAAAIENADLAQVAADLARRQTLYEATIASAATLLRLSLFDYLNY